MSSRLYLTFYASGFRSTAFNFNPKPAHPKILCHSLIELLSQVSPAFRKSFGALQKRRWAKQSNAWKQTCYMFNGDTLTKICLLSAAVTQSSAAPLRADRDTFPGVHLDRLSGRPHSGLCQNGGDAPQSHGPGGAHSWAGCRHDACKCGQLWYCSKIKTKWHKETKIRGLNLHLKLVEGDRGEANLFPSQIRDWNEELQGCRELARNSLQERLHRERSIFKVRAFRFWTYKQRKLRMCMSCCTHLGGNAALRQRQSCWCWCAVI